MDHVAIMKKSWGFLPLILSGEKTIESRWYMNRAVPWGRINAGDRVYFKDSGEPVTAVATVSKVLQFENLTPRRTRDILVKYGKQDGIEKDEIPDYVDFFKDKKYCILVFLSDVRTVKPFEINKRGFGAMAAWLTVPHIDALRK
ncbi:MAG TPA: ASCH domain-containing protein [Gemmatimonadaceae bacterium]|nr:ASCH domain-containing protein [Gemmatimonadaceae bacterium]